MKRRFRLGKYETEVIKAAGLGLLLLSAIVAPNLPKALLPFLKIRGKKGFKKALKRLAEKGIIYLGGEKVTLTKKGKRLQKEIELREIKINNSDKWDGIWRVIAYDIPDIYKRQREWFRLILERLNFKKIQESLWVYPYECTEEIAIISQNFRISPYVIVMTCSHLPNQEKWERRFGLKN